MITLNFDPRFADSIESGEKRQTIRRNRECVAGETLQLYATERKLADAVCTRIRPVWICETHMRIDGEWLQAGTSIAALGDVGEYDNDFARRDGFGGFLEMVRWLKTTYVTLPFNGFVIEWKLTAMAKEDAHDTAEQVAPANACHASAKAATGATGAALEVVLGELDLLRAEVRNWRECAKYDVTMEGAIFAGRWDRSALERCRIYAEQNPLDDEAQDAA